MSDISTLLNDINEVLTLGKKKPRRETYNEAVARIRAIFRNKANAKPDLPQDIKSKQEVFELGGEPYGINQLLTMDKRKLIDRMWANVPRDKKPVMVFGHKGIPFLLAVAKNQSTGRPYLVMIASDTQAVRHLPLVSEKDHVEKWGGKWPKKAAELLYNIRSKKGVSFTEEAQKSHLRRFFDSMKEATDKHIFDKFISPDVNPRSVRTTDKVPPAGFMTRDSGKSPEKRVDEEGNVKVTRRISSPEGMHEHRVEGEKVRGKEPLGRTHPKLGREHTRHLTRLYGRPETTDRAESYITPEGEYTQEAKKKKVPSPSDEKQLVPWKEALDEALKDMIEHHSTEVPEERKFLGLPEEILELTNQTTANKPWFDQLRVGVSFANYGSNVGDLRRQYGFHTAPVTDEDVPTKEGEYPKGKWQGREVEGDIVYSHPDIGDVIIQNNGINYLIFVPSQDRPFVFHTNKALDDMVRLYFEKRLPKPPNYQPYTVGAPKFEELLRLKERMEQNITGEKAEKVETEGGKPPPTTLTRGVEPTETEEIKRLKERLKQDKGANLVNYRFVTDTGAGRRQKHIDTAWRIFEAKFEEDPEWERFKHLHSQYLLNKERGHTDYRKFNTEDIEFHKNFLAKYELAKGKEETRIQNEMRELFYDPQLLNFSPLDDYKAPKLTDAEKADLEEKALDEQAHTLMLHTEAGQRWQIIRDMITVLEEKAKVSTLVPAPEEDLIDETSPEREYEDGEDIEYEEEIGMGGPKGKKKTTDKLPSGLTKFDERELAWLKSISRLAANSAKLEKAGIKALLVNKPVTVNKVLSSDGRLYRTITLTPTGQNQVSSHINEEEPLTKEEIAKHDKALDWKYLFHNVPEVAKDPSEYEEPDYKQRLLDRLRAKFPSLRQKIAWGSGEKEILAPFEDVFKYLGDTRSENLKKFILWHSGDLGKGKQVPYEIFNRLYEYLRPDFKTLKANNAIELKSKLLPYVGKAFVDNWESEGVLENLANDEQLPHWAQFAIEEKALRPQLKNRKEAESYMLFAGLDPRQWKGAIPAILSGTGVDDTFSNTVMANFYRPEIKTEQQAFKYATDTLKNFSFGSKKQKQEAIKKYAQAILKHEPIEAPLVQAEYEKAIPKMDPATYYGKRKFSPEEQQLGEQRLEERAASQPVPDTNEGVLKYIIHDMPKPEQTIMGNKVQDEPYEEYKKRLDNWKEKASYLYEQAKSENPELASQIEEAYTYKLRAAPYPDIDPLADIMPKVKEQAFKTREEDKQVALQNKAKDNALQVRERARQEAFAGGERDEKVLEKIADKAYNEAYKQEIEGPKPPTKVKDLSSIRDRISRVTGEKPKATPPPIPAKEEAPKESTADAIRRKLGGNKTPKAVQPKIEQPATESTADRIKRILDKKKLNG